MITIREKERKEAMKQSSKPLQKCSNSEKSNNTITILEKLTILLKFTLHFGSTNTIFTDSVEGYEVWESAKWKQGQQLCKYV